MGQWKEAKDRLASEHNVSILNVGYIAGQIVGTKHNPLTESGRTGGIVQQDEIVVRHLGIANILCREAGRVVFGERATQSFYFLAEQATLRTIQEDRIITDRDGSAQEKELRRIHRLPYFVRYEEILGIGMRHYTCCIGCIEIG